MCIGAIGGLSSQKTAQFGLALGVTGVTGAMSMTLAALPAGQLAPALGLVAAGGAAGFGLGKAVNPMALPQTVAAFHALVGAAAVATCLGSHLIHPDASVGHKAGHSHRPTKLFHAFSPFICSRRWVPCLETLSEASFSDFACRHGEASPSQGVSWLSAS